MKLRCLLGSNIFVYFNVSSLLAPILENSHFCDLIIVYSLKNTTVNETKGAIISRGCRIDRGALVTRKKNRSRVLRLVKCDLFLNQFPDNGMLAFTVSPLVSEKNNELFHLRAIVRQFFFRP